MISSSRWAGASGFCRLMLDGIQTMGEPMAEPDNVSQWIRGLKSGEPAAAQQLWERYFEQLVRIVNRKIPGHVRRVFDEEDIALSAFASFCDGVKHERFPRLEDRDDLWKVLVVITARKAQAYMRHHRRLKRGGGQLLGESALVRPDREDTGGLDQILGQEPTPEFAAQVLEEYQRLLEQLPNAELRKIAVLKMQGLTVEEIADRTGSTRRTVERRLQLIRRTWDESDPDADPAVENA